ncbi:MAG TPA: hypothetical protein VGD98_06780 [Ktedonobacteraceae bacterium]
MQITLTRLNKVYRDEVPALNDATYQFLFVGYWFWGNLLPGIGLPTLSDTILTPIGAITHWGYICSGFFNSQRRESICNPGLQRATAEQALASIVLLIGLAFLATLVLLALLTLQKRKA